MKTHTEQGPFEVIDLDSPFVFGIGRKTTPEERAEARKHGRTDDPPMSVLGITSDGMAGVFGEGTAHMFAASPDLLAALEALETKCGELVPESTSMVPRHWMSVAEIMAIISPALLKAKGGRG